MQKTKIRISLLVVFFLSFLPTMLIWIFLGNDFSISAANHFLDLGGALGVYFGGFVLLILITILTKFLNWHQWDQLSYSLPIGIIGLTIFVTGFGGVRDSEIARVGIIFACILVVLIPTNVLVNFVLAKASTYEIRQAEVVKLKSKPKPKKDFVAYIDATKSTKKKRKK